MQSKNEEALFFADYNRYTLLVPKFFFVNFFEEKEDVNLNKYTLIKFISKIYFLAFLLFIFVSLSEAKTYYVSSNGGSDGRSTTQAQNEATPWATIQQAANSAGPGDTVIVKDGIYTDRNSDNIVVLLRFPGTKSNWITFKSERKYGAIIDGQNKKTTFGFVTKTGVAYVRVEGFDIRYIRDTGIVINAANHDIDISNNTIHHIGKLHNTSGNGQNGIYCGSGTFNITVDSNYLYEIGRDETTTNHDHGIYLSGNPAARNIEIKNNIFANRDSGWPIHLYSPNSSFSNITIVNNTFTGQNITRDGHIALSSPMDNVLIQNNIFHNPRVSAITNLNCTNKTNVTMSNNISTGILINERTCDFILTKNRNKVDPLIVDPNNTDFKKRNYSLKQNSPAIDFGRSSSAPSYDFDGNLRPVDGNGDSGKEHDAGALEYINDRLSESLEPPYGLNIIDVKL